MSIQLGALICHGRDGTTKTFWYEWERDDIHPDRIIVFHVHKSNPPKMNEENWFEMTLELCGERLWKITHIGDAERRPHFAAAGIPDALIPEASRVLAAAIRSSSNRGAKRENEFRTIDADKMWKRLLRKGLARYVAGEDYYVCDGATAEQAVE